MKTQNHNKCLEAETLEYVPPLNMNLSLSNL